MQTNYIACKKNAKGGRAALSFSFIVHDNTVWAAISGEVDMQVAPLWRDALDRELAVSLARNLTFDFSEVSFIDSSGLGVMLGRYKKVSSRGGKVKIIGANKQVYRTLTLSGFAGLMEIETPSEETAGGGGH